MELNFGESKQKTINKIDLEKSPICTWSDLSLVEITKINLCEKCEDVKKFLCDKFGYNNDSLKLTEKINVDLFYHALKFCKDNKFNEEQTSALFTIIKTVHNKNTETSFDNLKPTYEHFRKLLSHHSVKRPPFCVQLYSVKELKLVIDYVTHTYFRHFKLYKYTFTPKVEMNLRVNYIGIPEEPVQEQSEEVNKDEEIDNTEEVKEEEGQATDDVENRLLKSRLQLKN